MRESFRLLRPGGFIEHSVFCTDYAASTVGTRYTFAHKIGNANVESPARPEAAVAYKEDFLLSLAAEVGFIEAKVNHQPGCLQPVLIARKPPQLENH
jgi:hypothetical protein